MLKMWSKFKNSISESPVIQIVTAVTVAYLYGRFIRPRILNAIEAMVTHEIRIVRKFIFVDKDPNSGEFKCEHQTLLSACNICLDTLARANIIHFVCEECGDLTTDDSCPYRPAPGEW